MMKRGQLSLGFEGHRRKTALEGLHFWVATLSNDVLVYAPKLGQHIMFAGPIGWGKSEGQGPVCPAYSAAQLFKREATERLQA